MGTGFVGTGPGWTSPTRARPVCHPNADEPYAMECEVVNAEQRCAEAHEVVDTARGRNQYDVNVREGADR